MLVQSASLVAAVALGVVIVASLEVADQLLARAQAVPRRRGTAACAGLPGKRPV